MTGIPATSLGKGVMTADDCTVLLKQAKTRIIFKFAAYRARDKREYKKSNNIVNEFFTSF